MHAKKNKTSLSIKEIINLVRACNINLSEKDITFNYAMSKMSVINESTHSSKIFIFLFFRVIHKNALC